MPGLTADDRLDIMQTCFYYGHLLDHRAFDRFPDVFTPDIRIEVRSAGQTVSVVEGLEAFQEFSASYPIEGFPEHHVSNIVISDLDHGALAQSQFMGATTAGDFYTGEYEFEFVRSTDGWRIRQAIITGRQSPVPR